MKIWLTLICLCLLLPAENMGLREIKVGDKVPDSDMLKISAAAASKIILYLKSDDIKSVSFFKRFAATIKSHQKVSLFLIDANKTTDKRVEKIYNELDIKKSIIADPDRHLYGSLGIIIIPSMLYVKEDNTLNSLIAGFRANLPLFFKEHNRALLKGEIPADVYKSMNGSIKKRKITKMLNQAFTLMINQNYELAESIYKKAVKEDAQKIEAVLGVGYALYFQGRVKESLDYFSLHKNKQDNKRINLGYYLAVSETDPAEASLAEMAQLALVEPAYFFVIFRAAEILAREGRSDQANALYKRSYEILLRHYRRAK